MKPNNNKSVTIIFVLLLVFSNFMSVRGMPFIAMRSIQILTLLVILFSLSTSNFAVMKRKNLVVKKYAWLFMLVPWLSLIPAYISHGQNPLDSATVIAVETGVFLIYFYLLQLNVTEQQLIKALTIFAFIYTFLELFQQITYPTYLFAGRGDSEVYDKLEMRLGLWKFYMFGIHFLVVPLFFYWEKVLQKAKLTWIICFTVFAIGLYAFLARKMLFSLFICIILSLFIGKNVKWYYWTLIIIVGVICFINLDAWFGEYIEKTTANLEAGDEWSRNRSRDFFLSYFDDALCVILGNGKESGASAYGEYIRRIAEWPMSLRRGDIGVYGHFSYYGIAGLIPVFFFIIFIFRKAKFLPLYIKLYFIFHLTQITVAFPFYSVNNASTLAIVLFLMELNIRRNRRLKRERLRSSYSTVHSAVDPRPEIVVSKLN